MSDHTNRKYLVVAEVGKKGFITEYITKYRQAEKIAKELILYGEIFPWSQPEKICYQLESRGYRTYSIRGNQVYFDNFIWVNSDGQFTVAIVKLNCSNFCLNHFIRERENYPALYEVDNIVSKLSLNFSYDFKRYIQVAN